MSTFTLAISCLTTSNVPWVMDLTFQVPTQYRNLYSIGPWFYHQSHPQLGALFLFGSISSFFLELFLLWSQVAYWAPTDLGSSSFSILLFCLLILFMGFSRQEYWSGLPFSSPVEMSPDFSLEGLVLKLMVGWHHRLEQGPKIGNGQESLMWCNP